MPKMQVDTGAIRFVLGGANVMCPGFTSPGGSLPVDVAVGQAVVGFDDSERCDSAIILYYIILYYIFIYFFVS
jgi:predicted RNA-binding protein (TIGR00451 family)